MAEPTKAYLTAIGMVLAILACRVNVSEEVLNHPILKPTFDQERALRIATGNHIEDILAILKNYTRPKTYGIQKNYSTRSRKRWSKS